MDKIIYKEESYIILGCCFDIFNEIGPGHRENTYQSALKEKFTSKNINFKEQVYMPVQIDGKTIAKNYFDFLVYDKIVIEIKKGDGFFRRDIEQLYSYLSVSKLKLGILVNFTSTGVKHKRVLNAY